MGVVSTVGGFVQSIWSTESHGPKRSERTKQGLIGLAAIRLVFALIALPLIPFLYHDHFVILVLLRPSLAILLTGAILARHGEISLPVLLAAAVPLQVVAVWLYFLLGDAWQDEINADDRLPFLVERLLLPEQVRHLRQTLRDHGPRLVVLARFAIFPVGLLAATAGASDMPPRSFFPSDLCGLVGSVGLVVGAGYGLDLSRQQIGPWLLAIGLGGMLVISGLLTWRIWHGSPEEDGDRHQAKSSSKPRSTD